MSFAMARVAIVGAGPIGGALAYALVQRRVGATVILLDEAINVAAGKALDVRQAAPVEQADTRVESGSDPGAVATADVVVLADQAASGQEWQGEPGLIMVERVARTNARAPILLAGAHQAWLIERALAELRLPVRRLAGTAPAAFAGAMRALVADATGAASLDVSVPLVGLPPDQWVWLWEEGTVAGEAMLARLSDAQLRSLEDRMVRRWPPGPYALASAAATACRIALGSTRQSMTCFVLGDGRAWDASRAMACAASLGPDGVEDVRMPALPSRGRARLAGILRM